MDYHVLIRIQAPSPHKTRFKGYQPDSKIISVQVTMTLAHEFLIIEAEALPVSDRAHDSLEILLKRAERIDISQEPRKLMRSLSGFLDKEGFFYRDSTLLCESLVSGTTACRQYSVLYLSIAEHLEKSKGVKIPLAAVIVPNHIFVRYTGENDKFNWETTSGKIKSDDWYRLFFNIPEESIKNKVYLNGLSRIEVRALAYCGVGFASACFRNDKEAYHYFGKALELLPRLAEAFNARGESRHKLKDVIGAMTDYGSATCLNPHFSLAYFNKGRALHALQMYKPALMHFNAAIKLNPCFGEAYFKRAMTNHELGNMAEETLDLFRSAMMGMQDGKNQGFSLH